MKPEDRAKVAAAIKAAEAKTDGEISTIVAASSDSYGDVVFVAAALVALLPLAVSAAWPGVLESGAKLLTGGWEEPTLRFMLTLLTIETACLFLIAWAVFRIAAIRTVLTPAAIETRRVRRRALMLFRTGTEQRTLSKTGVLLYLSLAEHRAEIVADAAIHSRAPQEAWGEAMAALIAALKDNRPGDGIAAAVERIGAVLAEHFPYTGSDPNELPDRLIEL
ncbi:TPM domain-containing protein [Sphingomonas sp. MMS24-J13]|uniref:TPM domain-containing protein n=1 Tax=Sphingomonas sp. MMS24-J13 TaxID=3238686 RepID=UPI00384FBE6C